MNADHEEVISATGSRVQVLVVFSDEVRLMQTPNEAAALSGCRG